ANACRHGHVDDALQLASDRAARSLRLAYAVAQLADTLHGRAITLGPVAWEDRYAQAVSELRSTRDKTIHTLASAESCEDPFDLGPKEFPLYFGNSASLVDQPISDIVNASAVFLLDGTGNNPSIGATAAVNAAADALGAARAAWVQRFTSGI